MYNNLFEMGGTASIYIKALCDFRDYKKDDIIATLDDVGIEFGFTNMNTNISNNVRNLLSYNIKSLNIIELNNINLDDQLLKLLHLEQEAKFTVTHAERWDKDAFQTVYLKYTPKDSKSFRLVPEVEYHYDEDSNSLEILDTNDKITDGVVYYQSEHQGINYILKNDADLPYLSLEIQFKGNINKKNGHALLNLPKVALIDNLELNLLNNAITNIGLSFKVIQDEKASPQLVLWQE